MPKVRDFYVLERGESVKVGQKYSIHRSHQWSFILFNNITFSCYCQLLCHCFPCWLQKREIATALSGPRNDEGGRGLAMTIPKRTPSPNRHCEEPVFWATWQSLVPGNSTNGNEGTQKRDCHACCRRLAMTPWGSIELALGDCFGSLPYPSQ